MDKEFKITITQVEGGYIVAAHFEPAKAAWSIERSVHEDLASALNKVLDVFESPRDESFRAGTLK